MFKKNIQTLLYTLLIGAVVGLVACDPTSKYKENEDAMIQAFLDNSPTLKFELKPSGLYYLDVAVGTGITPVKHDTAFIRYTGKFLDGTIFDSNTTLADPLSFPVDEGWLIPGFDEGVTYMKAGGKAMFLIPSSLGYGTQGYYSIPGYTPLLFDVELVKVSRGTGK
jgi:FKBP-type peptidyl-prolyl cis-trans isomerase FkpA